CVDIDENKIEMLKQGEVPIYEPEVKELLDMHSGKNLFFTTGLVEPVKKSNVVFIAVGTPSSEDGSVNLEYVKAAAADIGKAIDGYKVIVNKSTVPVGTGEIVESIISKHYKGEFDIVSNPEFLREGTAVSDFLKPDRIVIGCSSKRAMNIMKRLYSTIKAPILFTDIKSAELIKYASNAFLATKISFINEIANLCDIVGGNINSVADGMGLDKRIGREFLNAGIGFGGSCFPKDVKALISIARENGFDFRILRAVESVNSEQHLRAVEKLQDLVGPVNGKKIALLGLAFKPNTDDTREAPSIRIIEQLISMGAVVSVYDPKAMGAVQAIFENKLQFAENAYKCASGSDALMLITEWEEFKKLDLRKIRNVINKPNIIDGRNIYSRERLEMMGFNYRGVGR
ncbi:UDP-glucose 6-dehydrogenase, partial [Candidatus Woesearchaeota archaeon CG10_big_fil_rev_8_21_14_0_10_47_5]